MNQRILQFLIIMIFPAVCLPQVRPRPPAIKPAPNTPPAYMKELKAFDQDGAVTRVVLKNDLTILVAEAHANPVAEVMIRVKAGYGDEPPDLAGISRVLERMFWRGTTTRQASAMAADLRALGSTCASTTAYDYTSFRTLAPAMQWKRMLEILADALINPLFDEKELNRQVAAVGVEVSCELADPLLGADARLLGTGFAGGGLDRGWSARAETLNRITRGRLLDYYQSAYSANRILITVCGDVPTGEVLAAATGLYSKVKNGGRAPEQPPVRNAEAGFRYAQDRTQERLARLQLGFRTVPAAAPDRPALDLLAAMLDTGEGAILKRRIMHQKKLVMDVTADNVALADTGYLALRFLLDPKDLDRCEIAVFTEFEILKRQEPDENELIRARAQAEREYWERMQTISARADQLVRFEDIGSWKLSRAYLERLAKVKWTDIKRVAARYLTLDNCTVLESLPVQAESRSLTGTTVESTIKSLLEPATEQEMEEREKETVPAVDAPAGNENFKPSEVHYPFQMASILRGPGLFIREDHTIPYVHLGLMFPGGKLFETRTNAGVTALMLHTMLRDSKNISADQIYKQLEMYGARIVPVMQDDYFGIYMAISSANVDAGLNLLSEWIRQPRFDSDEVSRQKRFLQAALRNRSAPEIAIGRLRQMLFAAHPYAQDIYGTETSLDALTPETVQEWHKKQVVDKRPIVVIVGDTQGTSLAGFFVRNFSGSRFEEVKLPEDFPKALTARSAGEGDAPGGISALFAGFQGPPDGDEDSFPLRVLESYAGGLGGRLVSRIGDEVSGAIRISLQYQPELRGGFIMADLAVAPAEEAEGFKVLTEEIERLGTDTVTYRDYRSAVAITVGEIQIGRQERSRQIQDLICQALLGAGLDGYVDEINRLLEVKQTDLQAVAQRMLKLAKSVTLRLHGKSGQ